MTFSIKFTLSGCIDPAIKVCLYEDAQSHGARYFCGMTYEVSDSIAQQMLALSGFRPFGPIQAAINAYHKMYELTP